MYLIKIIGTWRIIPVSMCLLTTVNKLFKDRLVGESFQMALSFPWHKGGVIGDPDHHLYNNSSGEPILQLDDKHPTSGFAFPTFSLAVINFKEAELLVAFVHKLSLTRIKLLQGYQLETNKRGLQIYLGIQQTMSILNHCCQSSVSTLEAEKIAVSA